MYLPQGEDGLVRLLKIATKRRGQTRAIAKVGSNSLSQDEYFIYTNWKTFG